MAVVGAGLVGAVPGLRAGLPGGQRDGHRRRPSGAGHRRRGGHPLAGHQHGGRRAAVAVPAPGRRPLPGPAAADGRRRRRRRRDGLRPLRHPLRRPARRTRTSGSPPSPSWCSAARPARWPRSRRRRPARSSRPSARCTASCTRPARRGSTAGAWPPRCARPRRRAAWPSCAGAAHGVVGRRGAAAGGRHVEAVEVEGHQNVACAAVAVAGGAWTAAAGEWLGTRLPVGPTKGQIVHLGVGAETGDWPIVQPLLTHYLVPWPGGRVACGGTFEAGAGFSVSVTAAGPPRAPARVPDGGAGAGRRHLPRDAGRAAAHLGRRPRRRRAGCRAGATPGWPPGTAPTACCRAPTRPGCWRTPWRAWPSPADEAPLPGSFDPGRFA